MGVALQRAELTGLKIVALADPAPSVVGDGAASACLHYRAYLRHVGEKTQRFYSRTRRERRQWAHVRFECFGPSIKVWVNGVPTSNRIDEKSREGSLVFKIHSSGKRAKAGRSTIRFINILILTEQPQRFAQPMVLVARRTFPVPDRVTEISNFSTVSVRPSWRTI